MTDYLVGQGVERGGGTVQYGGFLGMLASIGVPLAIEAIKGLLRKGMHTNAQPPPSPPAARFRRSSGTCKGMHVNPHLAQLQPSPPFFGT